MDGARATTDCPGAGSRAVQVNSRMQAAGLEGGTVEGGTGTRGSDTVTREGVEGRSKWQGGQAQVWRGHGVGGRCYGAHEGAGSRGKGKWQRRRYRQKGPGGGVGGR